MKKFPNPNIKLLALDVDGVLTDAGMYYTESGDEFKKFNSKDGLGIMHLQRSGVKVAFLSSGKNINIIRNRSKLLGVELFYMGMESKKKILIDWMKKLNIRSSETAYMGDDVNDLECIDYVGLSACPADAVSRVKKAVTVVLKTKGGEGCVREFIEKYLLKI